MKHQLQQIREALETVTDTADWGTCEKALTALSELEAMVGEQEPCGWFESPYGAFRANPLLNVTFPASTLTWQIPAFIATPPAQQPQKLEDSEQYRMQMAGISTAATGYWKEGDPIHPDYDTPALRDVAKLYAKYDALYKAQQQYEAGDMASAAAQGFRDGVASVAQQPRQINALSIDSPITIGGCPFCGRQSCVAGQCQREPVAQQPQAEAVTENTSDGYHTFKELYAFRKAYNAALFNEWAQTGKCQVHKSWRHHGGELCFGGGWFIVVAVLPDGQISNHYEAKDWELFNIPETAKALYEFDGHTGADVIARLEAFKGTAPQQAEAVPSEDWYSPDSCSFCGMVGGHTKTCRRRTAPQQAEAVPSDVARDAARYRWLRDYVPDPTEQEFLAVGRFDDFGAVAIEAADLDDAIDAAMAQGANHG